MLGTVDLGVEDSSSGFHRLKKKFNRILFVGVNNFFRKLNSESSIEVSSLKFKFFLRLTNINHMVVHSKKFF